jgi:hypothetical protein
VVDVTVGERHRVDPADPGTQRLLAEIRGNVRDQRPPPPFPATPTPASGCGASRSAPCGTSLGALGVTRHHTIDRRYPVRCTGTTKRYFHVSRPDCSKLSSYTIYIMGTPPPPDPKKPHEYRMYLIGDQRASTFFTNPLDSGNPHIVY